MKSGRGEPEGNLAFPKEESMARRLIVGVALLLVSLTIVACGSGGGSETTAISKAAFEAKAKAICVAGTEKIDTLYAAAVPKALKHSDSEEILNKAVQGFVIPIRTKEVREIRALGPPAVGAKKVEAFLEAMEEGIEEGKKDRRTLRSTGHYAFDRALNLSEGIGLGACFLG
jgi:hypothetical protein